MIECLHPQLQNALTDNRKIVYLCGAGASMSLGDHRLSWPNWILAGKKYLEDKDQRELDKLIGSWKTEQLIDAVTFLLEKLKFQGSYESFMDSSVGSLHSVNMDFKEALRRIWRTGDLIATTNYDLTIEEAINTGTVTYSTPAEILSVIRGDAENKVIHLHGAYDKLHGIDDIVADDPQYRSIISDAGAQFIQNLIGTHTLIIIGCGGTLEDPNLTGFMTFVTEKLGCTNVPYFYLMKNGDAVPNLPSNAIPIYYGDDYEEMPLFLSTMSIFRLQRRKGMQSVVALNPYIVRKTVVSAFGRMHFSNRFSEFVGRVEEKERLADFLTKDEKFSWWMILGEGGIGKSRLILEWLRNIPANWYGFFTHKHPDAIDSFIPFTDTVIVIDYVLGQEETSARIIEAYLSKFTECGYRLRIILLERTQKNSGDDWFVKLTRLFQPEIRLDFDAAKHDEPLILDALSENDEKEYVRNYLDAFLKTLPGSDFVHECEKNADDVSKQISKVFRLTLDKSCYRPLYLSIFIEVWVGKEGRIDFNSTEELLSEFLTKEKKRWKIILGKDNLVDSYLRLLSVACAIEQFNITDNYGNNYLEADCQTLTEFLDEKSNKPGADNLFGDLFVSMDELVDDAEDDDLVELFFKPNEAKTDNLETVAAISKLETDERMAFFSPYIKLQADPVEVYLQMMVGAGIAEDEEIAELERVREKRKKKVDALPDHAWIIEPVFPDIIKEFIVTYVVNERDITRFTKLARSNSIMGIANFISRFLEDWPSNEKIQKIATTPPDEMLNYFEYYVGILSNVRLIEDLKSVENTLVSSDPLFQRYEIELWRRIAFVLVEREDINNLFDSGCRFVEYLKNITGMVSIRDDAADVINEYCYGLHNAGEHKKHEDFLKMCDEVAAENPGNQRIGEVLCENYHYLVNAKVFGENIENVEPEWNATEQLLQRHQFQESMCVTAMETAHDYMLTLLRRNEMDKLQVLKQTIESIYTRVKVERVCEVAALCTANVYINSSQLKKSSFAEEITKIKDYIRDYPESVHIRSAYISMLQKAYLETSSYRKVPDSILNQAKEWSLLYPDEIEFPEGYFGLLLARLEYAQDHDQRNEQRRIFREMKAVAQRTDYSEYNETNHMRETVEMLARIYGY